jgi:hypothetical protein
LHVAPEALLARQYLQTEIALNVLVKSLESSAKLLRLGASRT